MRIHCPSAIPWGALLAFVLAILATGDPSARLAAAPADVGTAAPPATTPSPTQTIAATPMRFEARSDDGGDRYEAHGLGYGLRISAHGAQLALPAPGAPQRLLTLDIDGAHGDARLVGEQPLSGVVNRYVGDRAQWQTGNATFARVTARGVRPGIDVTYYGTQQQLEYDFVIAPGTDPAAAGLIVGGADRVSIDAAGDLVLERRRPDVAPAPSCGLPAVW